MRFLSVEFVAIGAVLAAAGGFSVKGLDASIVYRAAQDHHGDDKRFASLDRSWSEAADPINKEDQEDEVVLELTTREDTLSVFEDSENGDSNSSPMQACVVLGTSKEQATSTDSFLWRWRPNQSPFGGDRPKS